MKHSLLPLAVLLGSTVAAHAVDFKTQLTPIFKQYCYKCHSDAEKKDKGKLVLDNPKKFGDRIADGKIITPGKGDSSSFYTCLNLPKDDDDHMPPAKDPQPTAAQIAVIKQWIDEGASLTGGKAAAAPAAPATPAALTPPGGGAMQNWTSADGKVIQAKFIKLDGENVVIQRADGQTFSVPLSRLSPESQAQAKKGG